MTPPSPDELNAELIDPEQPAPEPFREPVCAMCRYPIGQSFYGVLCNDCGSEWLYSRESDRAATFGETATRSLSGDTKAVKPRWRIC